MDEFKSITKFKVFNTNNLWASLSAIDRLVTKGSMVNDVIVNKKVSLWMCVCWEERGDMNVELGRDICMSVLGWGLLHIYSLRVNFYNACTPPTHTHIGAEQQCKCDPAGDSCWSRDKELYWSCG